MRRENRDLGTSVGDESWEQSPLSVVLKNKPLKIYSMKKMFKKLTVVASFSLMLLLTSCESGFNETQKIKNELDRCIEALNSGGDTITIKPDEVATVKSFGGRGLSQFSFTDEQMDIIPVIIFNEDVLYKIDTMSDWDLVNTFEKSIFKKSCWEILSVEDKKWRESYEVLYRITEDDYQNAIILNECEDTPTPDTLSPNTPSQNVNISDFSVSECLERDRGLMYDNDTTYAVAINDNSLMIRSTAYFNCCSEEFWEELSMEGNKIRIEMFEDDKEPCDCICPVSVEFVLSNLELGQTYKIVLSRGVYGYFSFEVVFEKDTDLMFIIS